MGRVGLVSHPAFLEHDMGSHHPESPERLRAILGQLESILEKQKRSGLHEFMIQCMCSASKIKHRVRDMHLLIRTR